jgi:hypothetical protein
MARQNLNDVVAFLAVAKERSFTKAAAKLGVSQADRGQGAAEAEAPEPVKDSQKLPRQLMRRGITPSAPAHGRMFAFSIVRAPDLACGVSTAMTLNLVGVLR